MGGFTNAQIQSAYGVQHEDGRAFRLQLWYSLVSAAVVVAIGVGVALWEVMNGRNTKEQSLMMRVCEWTGSLWRYIDILSSSRLRTNPSPSFPLRPNDESVRLIDGRSNQY